MKTPLKFLLAKPGPTRLINFHMIWNDLFYTIVKKVTR